VWNIDQFAVKNNRPDIILQRLGSENEEQIQNFYMQYIKRLIKYNLIPEQIKKDIFENQILDKNITEDDKGFLLSRYTLKQDYYILKRSLPYREKLKLLSIPSFLKYVEAQLEGGYHVPEAEIVQAEHDDKFVDLTFTLSDSKYNLYSYNIYVNDVALYKDTGKQIQGNNVTITEKIELTGGENKIEVSCLNEKLAESYRDLTFADYEEQVKGNLYFIGFGVSDYKDPSIPDLLYPQKDVNDLESLFLSMGDYFNKIYTYSYTESDCTIENIKNAKGFLADATVDDIVVLFISGHGLHSKDMEATYYYITYDTQIMNLSETAADFDLIEDILDGINPRKKLFLMDTCESGEMDEDLVKRYFALASTKGFRPRTMDKGLEVVGEKLKEQEQRRSYLLDKDRFIYNDIFRRTGAIVFSSSGGGEYSYEPGVYKEDGNGFFTGEIIKSFTDKKVDKDKDGFVSTDEMRDYVIKSVSEISDGLQNPTVDRDNIYQEFGFPLVEVE